jgi:membrane-bound serine protease (ClpP class)
VIANIIDGVSNVMMVIAFMLATAVLLLVDVITPSFGILTGLAIGSFGAGVYFAFTIHSIAGFLALLGGFILGPLYLYGMVKILPNTAIGRRLFLDKAPKADRDATPEADRLAELVGKTGVAVTTLRPSGEVKVDGQRVDARAEHAMISKGQRIKVIRSGGTDVVVRPAPETPGSS